MHSSTLGGTYFNYDNIPLKLYYDVAASSDFKLLLIGGGYNESEAVEAWESIIRDNCKATNTRKYVQYITAYKEYLRLLNDQTYIKTALIRLHFPPIDHDLIKELGIRGFKINTESSDKYAQSLRRADNQSKNLNTRIKVQLSFIKRIYKDEERDAQSKANGFQQSLARVSSALNLVLPQEILLSAYNEYCNILKERATASRKAA